MRQHIAATISDELMQAARIDGASTWQIFWRIAFPIVRPAAFVLGLFGFVTAWNDFLWPFIVLKSPERFTAQIAIKALQNSYTIDLGLAMSGSFLATLPLLVLFVVRRPPHGGRHPGRSLQGVSAYDVPRHGIHDTAPAARWEDGFVSGNGEYGLLALGDPAAERLVVSHHRFVLPNGSRQMAPPAVADRLDEVRDLVLAGDAPAAQRAFCDGRRLAWTQSFHPGFLIETRPPEPGPGARLPPGDRLPHR